MDGSFPLSVCESGDTFALRGKWIVEAGDLFVFRIAGAYGAAMSSGYNSRPVTPEVLVKDDRRALVRKRLALAGGVGAPACLDRRLDVLDQSPVEFRPPVPEEAEGRAMLLGSGQVDLRHQHARFVRAELGQ